MAAFVAGQGRAAWGETVPCEMPDKIGVHDASARGRGRDDHAVELPGRDPVVEDPPRAACRQRRRHQTVRARARVLRGVRRRMPRRRHPRRPRAGRARLRRGGVCTHHARLGASRVVHRVGSDRARGRGGRDATRAEARFARARRQERDDRHGRRRPRPRRRRRAVRCFRYVRPALHVDLAARSCTASIRDEVVDARRGACGTTPCSAIRGSPLPTSAPSSTCHSRDRIDGMVQAAIGEGATVATGGRSLDGRRLRRRRVLRADDPHRRAPRPPDRARRGVRPGSLGHRRRPTSTTRSPS